MKRAVVVALAAGACVAQPPNPDDPGSGGLDPEARYADTVLAMSRSSGLISCSDVLPACGQDDPDACELGAALGAPDGFTVPLAPGEILTVGFRCTYVAENGGASSADLKIWATLEVGAEGLVEVSVEGSEYEVLTPMTESDQSFDLAWIELEAVQLVQITNVGTASMAIDALEALRSQ